MGASAWERKVLTLLMPQAHNYVYHIFMCLLVLSLLRSLIAYGGHRVEAAMSDTVNFTGSVDRDLLKRAKVIAAKCDTSINALFNAQLRFLVETFERAEESRNANYVTLLGFSLGALGADEVLRALGLDSEEDLCLLMAQAHLPMPRLPQAATDDMVKALHGLG